MKERYINEAVRFIQDRCQLPIDVAAILGSGWSSLAGLVQDPIIFPYHRIPHFGTSSVDGHEGQLIIGRLNDKIVMFMNGRIHYYEGYSAEEVAFPIRVMARLGINTVILTNAGGGIRDDLNPGDIAIINDHISLFAPSPLRGENLTTFGPRFPSSVNIYTPALRERAFAIANEAGIPIKEGVYCFYPGPQFESPADIRALRTLGADICGMSTVPEALVAAHSGLRVLGLTLITNKAAGLSAENFSHETVLAQAHIASRNAMILVEKFINAL